MEQITLATLFLIGLSYGSTACMFTCMPFLTPLLLTKSKNYKQTFGVLIPFSLGRIFTYTVLALVASASSMLVKDIINNPSISQTLLGSVTIIVALFILKNALSQSSSCCTQTNHSNTPSNKTGYFLMGAGISLNPCVPVMTLITASAYATSSLEAISFGFIFGLGAITASFLVFGILFSQMAKGFVMEFAKYKKYIELSASLLLLVVGIATLNGYLSL